MGPYRFCSSGNPATLSILLWSYLILSDTHIFVSITTSPSWCKDCGHFFGKKQTSFYRQSCWLPQPFLSLNHDGRKIGIVDVLSMYIKYKCSQCISNSMFLNIVSSKTKNNNFWHVKKNMQKKTSPPKCWWRYPSESRAPFSVRPFLVTAHQVAFSEQKLSCEKTDLKIATTNYQMRSFNQLSKRSPNHPSRRSRMEWITWFFLCKKHHKIPFQKSSFLEPLWPSMSAFRRWFHGFIWRYWLVGICFSCGS